jgi:anti-sigma B factor antagonist
MNNALRLEGELTIYRATELKQVLVQAVAAPGPLEVDLSAVTELDTAGAQLLILATKTALAANKQRLRVVGQSRAVTEVFDLMNLASHFSQ